MKVLQTEISDKENSVKYLLMDQDKEIGYGYIFDRDTNPIEIYIHEQYRSNGYGKFLFNNLLEIVKTKGLKGIVFKLTRYQYCIMSIVEQNGALLLEETNGVCTFVLKF